MEEETDKILKDQLRKLPKEILDFISSTSWDTDLDEIGSLYNLSETERADFKREVTLVLAGLTHPDEFHTTLEQEVGIQGAVLDAIVNATEERIFAPVRPALVEFFERESAESSVDVPVQEEIIETIPTSAPTPTPAPTPARTWEKEPDVAPDNLPTAEEPESFLPPIPQKKESEPLVWDITHTPTHPFEEKMKKVFTAGQQSMGDFSIEPAGQQAPQVAPPSVPMSAVNGQMSNVPPVSRTYHADPYREPIE